MAAAKTTLYVSLGRFHRVFHVTYTYEHASSPRYTAWEFEASARLEGLIHDFHSYARLYYSIVTTSRRLSEQTIHRNPKD